MGSVMPVAFSARKEVASEIPSRTYLTHGIDRYPAKMIPHLARYAISKISNEGDIVLDPFCGCGTVQVECRVLGRASVGFDVNPVAVFLARGKSAICSADILRRHADKIIEDAKQMVDIEVDTPPWLKYWFTPATLAKLCAIRRALVRRRRRMGQNYYDALRAGIIVCVRRCSKADPRSPKPFISRAARESRLGKHFDPFREFETIVDRLAVAGQKLQSLMNAHPTACTAQIADSRNLSRHMKASSVDAVVTSPPYLTAQDYFRSSKLELGILGKWTEESPNQLGMKIIGSGRGRVPNTIVEVDELYELSQLRKQDSRSAAVATIYRNDMRRVLCELRTVLKARAKCVFVVGDCTIRGIHLPVHEWFVELGQKHGFKLTEHLVDTIQDRRLPPRRVGHTGLIQKEHLLFFRKEDR